MIVVCNYSGQRLDSSALTPGPIWYRSHDLARASKGPFITQHRAFNIVRWSPPLLLALSCRCSPGRRRSLCWPPCFAQVDGDGCSRKLQHLSVIAGRQARNVRSSPSSSRCQQCSRLVPSGPTCWLRAWQFAGCGTHAHALQ